MKKEIEQALKFLRFINESINEKIVTFNELREGKVNKEKIKKLEEYLHNILNNFQFDMLSNADETEKFLYSTLPIFTDFVMRFEEMEELFRTAARNYSDHIEKFVSIPSEIINQMLTFKKIKETIFNDKDIYILVKIYNGFIINDGYKGIIVLDNDLNIKKKIFLFDGICLDLHFSFKNNFKNEILFFCPENQCLLHLNLITLDKKIIKYKENLLDLILSKVYYWNNNETILASETKEFYKIDIIRGVMEKISILVVKDQYPVFYKFLIKSLGHRRISFYNEQNRLVYKDEEREQVKLLDETGKKVVSFNYNDPDFYDIQFKDGFFMLNHDHKIEIYKSALKKTEIVSHLFDRFLKAEFIKKGESLYVVILASNVSGIGTDSLLMYEIIEKKKYNKKKSL